MFFSNVGNFPLLPRRRPKPQSRARATPFEVTKLRRFVSRLLYLQTSLAFCRAKVTVRGRQFSFLGACRYGDRYHGRLLHYGTYRRAASTFLYRVLTRHDSYSHVSVSKVGRRVHATLWYLVDLKRNLIYRGRQVVKGSILSNLFRKGATNEHNNLGTGKGGCRLLF